MSDPITDEMKADLDEIEANTKEIINANREAREALINIRYETGMASIYIKEVLHGSSGNVGDLLRHVEQNLRTIEEHLGNVLGDVPGEEMEASNE